MKTVRTVYDEGGMHWVRDTTQTPVGDVYALTANGWRQKGLLSTPQDFRVMTHLVEHGEQAQDNEGEQGDGGEDFNESERARNDQ